MKKTIDCSDLVGTYTLNEMPELLNKLQDKIDVAKGKRKEDLQYLKIRIYKNGKVDSVKSTKSEYDMLDGNFYHHFNPNKKKEHDFFITTNFNLRKDCKKFFNGMLKGIESEQKILDKKRENINKMISNSKEL